MAYLNAITKTIKQIQDSDEDTRDRYNYHRGLSLHMIKKLMGADHSQWGYINNALKSGVNKGKLIKTGGKYRVAVTKKKSRKLRKCKYGRDRTTGKCRKKSAKRKTSRKRRSVKRKGNKKLKFRMITDEEKKQIKGENLTCPICMGELKDANNEDIVGCMGAKNIPGWTCCSKTKKTGGCKNVYFHKKCLETWKESQKARHQEPSCPNCRAKQAPSPPSSRGRWKPNAALLLTGGAALGAAHGFYQGFTSVPNLERCHNPEIGSSLGEGLPTCDECNFVQPTSDGVLTWHWPRGAPGGMCPQHFADSYTNWHANMDGGTWRKRIQAEVSREKL